MINFGGKVDLNAILAMIQVSHSLYLWGLEGIIGREMNSQKEDTTLVRAIFRTHNSCLPVEEVISNRTCRTGRRGIAFEIFKFLLTIKKQNNN